VRRARSSVSAPDRARFAPRSALIVPLAAAAIAMVIGWRLFWFLTDDAFITFRYASNAMAGLGFTWNPPPFAPVEGYSSFLWLVVLTAVWCATGLPPPDTANGLSLACGFATLVLCAAALWRMLERAEGPWRGPIFAVALATLVTSRTFLTWLSSGLETSLWNALLVWWVIEAVRVPVRAGALPRLCGAAALLALARPDGLAYWAATLAIAAPRARPAAGRVMGAALLAAPLLHLAWRRRYYGEWLPNTYYAKVIAPWPAMGVRYLASFTIEHGLWVCAAAIGYAAVLAARRGAFADLPARWRTWAAPVLMLGALLGHTAYYVLIVGGDHFEYRVFSHWIPLSILALVAALGAARVSPPLQLAALAVYGLSAAPIPWVHWWQTHNLDTRRDTFQMRVPIAARFPWPFQPLVAVWDRLQADLISHSVGNRHQEHLIFYRYQIARNPTREQGSQMRWVNRHVLASGTIGVPGWVLPGVAVIDRFGLNDRVIAHAPLRAGQTPHQMAHDRRPPPGYLQCLRPDLRYEPATPEMVDRPLPADVAPASLPGLIEEISRDPLRDADILACEAHAWY
jgi:arabinofuranosyltransferase